MPLSFLAPIFLAGAALVGVPWLIHQIRRPEREPLRFSSLMFIPKVDRQIIERRRLQHILLMLLRMLLFVLLAAAFSRPYWKTPQAAPTADEPGRHIILLDTSYSMGTSDWFADAKEKAKAEVASIGPTERVAVIAFGDSPKVLAPLESSDDKQAGTRDRAKSAIDSAGLTEEGTAYLPSLQFAQDLLLRDEDKEQATRERLVVHLISDFQRGGMPENALGWKLSPRIQLKSVEVGKPETENFSISDLSVRKTAESQLRIQGKVKNWSAGGEKSREVKLVVNGEEKEKKQLTISPQNASQISFLLAMTPNKQIEGWLEIGKDTLEIDNRRYFVWDPPRKSQILLASDPQPNERYPAALFIDRALPHSEELPWQLERIDQAKLQEHLRTSATLPDLLLLCDITKLDPKTAETALSFASDGGQVLVCLGPAVEAEAVNQLLLSKLGLKSSGLRNKETNEARFDLMNWVDFDHPIFAPFQGARFNDFSMLHFFNYHVLTVETPAGEGSSAKPKVLATLEGKEGTVPAVVEVPVGKGRVVVWPFQADLAMTNLPKTIKFVPILFESISYLTGTDEVHNTWEVGNKYAGLPVPSGTGGKWLLQLPGEEEKEFNGEALAKLGEPEFRHSGFFRWKTADEAAAGHTAAVNIKASEADPARIGLQEFELRLTAAPIVTAVASGNDKEADRVPAGFAIRNEYWQWIICVMFLSLLVESWYAFRLIR